MDHYDANGTKGDVLRVADRMIVIEPDALRRGPSDRVPGVDERPARRHAIALLEWTCDADVRPQRRLGADRLRGIWWRQRVCAVGGRGEDEAMRVQAVRALQDRERNFEWKWKLNLIDV